MSKLGILTKEEEKFFARLITEEIHIEGVWKPLVRWALPSMIGAIDNRVGDKIPEPWQTHVEKLTTLVYDSMQDKIITVEEQNEILDFTAEVINTEVDVPLLDETEEALMFITLLQFFASVIRKWVKNATVVNG